LLFIAQSKVKGIVRKLTGGDEKTGSGAREKGWIKDVGKWT